jgi:hypothetical protein
MRFFQNFGLSPAYRRYWQGRVAADGVAGYRPLLDYFLSDRYCATHILLPVFEADSQACFAVGDDEVLQRAWAKEKGMRRDAELADILLAQIEEHRSEVFYNIDPMVYGAEFLKRLPGCVKFSIAWRAAPSGSIDFSSYDRVVCNFPNILESLAASGCKTAYFFPSHDPVMDGYAANQDRPIDICFVGGYSRHHAKRAEVLTALASLSNEFKIALHLDCSRLMKWAESPLAAWLPLRKYRRPESIRRLARAPVFGRELYRALSSAKIVLNGAIDMAGRYRGNMRCWEAMGCGSIMLSDEGIYPPEMRPGVDFRVYADPAEMVRMATEVLRDYAAWRPMGEQAAATMRTAYSKSKQWSAFEALVAAL